MLSTRSTRRGFVASTSLAVAGTLLGTRRLEAHRLATTLGDSSPSQAAQAFLPEPMMPAHLRHLATSAVEAATRAGATYADFRVGERHILRLDWNFLQPNVDMTSGLTYGVRVLVDGAWAFIHGSDPTVDAVTASARDAVTIARGYAPLIIRRTELAPVSVTTGEWIAPCEQDPFAVPLRDHGSMMGAYYQLTQRVHRGRVGEKFEFSWTKETRVFASSEGTLTTQTLRGVSPTVWVAAVDDTLNRVSLPFPSVHAVVGGYETVGDPTRYEDAYVALVEDAARYLMLPRRTMDVGRYPVVLDGGTLGFMFGRTTGTALELDRVLGEEADASGTSYLGPPLDILGTPIANSKLTVTATRALPMPSAVKWDDEGVESHSYPVISEGRLVDYHTSRSTASVLRTWYEQQGRSLRSHGCTVATNAAEPPSVRAPHLSIEANHTSTSLDTLCKDVRDGILVLGIQECASDQQFASGSIMSRPHEGPSVGMLLKLEQGRVVSRVVGNGLETATRRLWKEQLVMLGDASTVQHADFEVRKGMPWRRARQSVAAPAALFKDVNVVRYHR
jgi:TldD protein